MFNKLKCAIAGHDYVELITPDYVLNDYENKLYAQLFKLNPRGTKTFHIKYFKKRCSRCGDTVQTSEVHEYLKRDE